MSPYYHKSFKDGELPKTTSPVLPPNEFGPTFSFEIQSGRCRFTKSLPIPGMRRGGGIRGDVTICTDASRRRLMQRFASLDYDKLAEWGCKCYWVTLTTPRAYWEDVEGVYKALRKFHDRLEYSQRETDYKGAFVRRELGGKNGALHYHACIFGGEGITKAWLRENWAACLGYEGKDLQVHVESADDPKRIAKYMSKYCSKAGYEGKEYASAAARKSAERSFSAAAEGEKECSEGEGEGASLTEAHNVGKQRNAYTGGRWWYIWGASALPWGEILTIEGLDAQQIANRMKRFFRRWRLQATGRRIDAEMKMPGIAFRTWTPHYLEKFDTFVHRLKRDRGGGFTLLLSPDLIYEFVKAALYSMNAQDAYCSSEL